MGRQFRVAIMSGAALAVIAWAPAPVWAQENDALEEEARSVRGRLEIVREFERQLAQAEAFRQSGDCRNVAAMDLDVHTTTMMSDAEAARIQTDFRARMREIALRDCPPGSGRPSIDPAAFGLTLSTPAPARGVAGPTAGGASGAQGGPGTASPPPAAEPHPDGDDIDSILDDTDAGLRSLGLSPGDADATPVSAAPASAGTGAQALTPAQTERLAMVQGMVAEMEAAARSGDCRRAAELRDTALQLSFMTIPDAMRDSMIARMRAIYEEFCAPRLGPQSYGPTIGVLGGFGQARVPQASGGFEEQGGEEVAAGTSPRGIDYFRLAGFIEFNAGSLPLRFGASYGEGSGSSVFDVPSGTRSGVVNGAESPNGSTGISAFEGVGGTARVERRDITVAGSVQIAGRGGIVPVFELGLYGGGAWNESWFEERESFPTQLLFGASFWTSYTFSESDYGVRAGASGTTSGGFSFAFEQDRAFEIREHLFGAGLAGGIAIPLAPRVTAHGGGSVGVFYRDSRLELTEVNTLNFGSDAPGFSIELEDEDKRALFRGDLGAGVSVALGDDVALTIGGSASWFSNLAAPFAPEDGDAVLDGVIAGLGRDDAWIYQGTIGITFRIANPR